MTTSHEPGWTICVASSDPTWMGFCSLQEWPCIYDPLRTAPLHLWGCRLTSGSNLISNEFPHREGHQDDEKNNVIFVLGYSHGVKAGDTSKTNVSV